jgi:hypothetical protein
MCNKLKLDKIKGMLILANAQKARKKSHKRQEKNMYWCVECMSYHTTSRK